MININKIIYDSNYKIINNDNIMSFNLSELNTLLMKIKNGRDSINKFKIKNFEGELYNLILSFINDNINNSKNISLFFYKGEYEIKDINLLRYTFNSQDPFKYINQINNFKLEYHILCLIYNFLEFFLNDNFNYLEISFNLKLISFNIKMKDSIDFHFIKNIKSKYNFKNNKTTIKYFDKEGKCNYV